RTAGNIFAWYDSRGAGVDIPDVIKVPIPDMKKRLSANDNSTNAYAKAMDDYKNAPPTQPAQTAAPAPVSTSETYAGPSSYPVSSYGYDVPVYYPPVNYYYYSSAPYWYPAYSPWCGWGV